MASAACTRTKIDRGSQCPTQLTEYELRAYRNHLMRRYNSVLESCEVYTPACVAVCVASVGGSSATYICNGGLTCHPDPPG